MLGNDRKWLVMGVGVCFNAICARFALLQPTRNLYPHTLLPGGLGGGAPQHAPRQGKTYPEEVKKSKFVKSCEMLGNDRKWLVAERVCLWASFSSNISTKERVAGKPGPKRALSLSL